MRGDIVKHVLALSTIYPTAASPQAGMFVAHSLQALARRGDWRVSMIHPIAQPLLALRRERETSDLPERREEHGVTAYHPRYAAAVRTGPHRRVRALVKACLPLVEAIHAETPVDVLSAQWMFPDGPVAAHIADALSIPFSIKARGSTLSDAAANHRSRDAMQNATARADGLLAVSQKVAADLATLGVARERITVHYTGLDHDRFRPLEHTQLRSQIGSVLGLDLPFNAPLLVCVGELTERKGQSLAIAALPDIDGARLILVGEGDDRARLEAQAEKLEVVDRVHFTGAVDHDLLPLILSACDAMVLPTSREGLSNAWVEALACGKPVVTIDVGGAREVLRDETAGRLIGERTPEAIAAAVNAVLNAPPHPLAVAEHVADLSWERHAKELAAHLDKVAAKTL